MPVKTEPGAAPPVITVSDSDSSDIEMMEPSGFRTRGEAVTSAPAKRQALADVDGNTGSSRVGRPSKKSRSSSTDGDALDTPSTGPRRSSRARMPSRKYSDADTLPSGSKRRASDSDSDESEDEGPDAGPTPAQGRQQRVAEDDIPTEGVWRSGSASRLAATPAGRVRVENAVGGPGSGATPAQRPRAVPRALPTAVSASASIRHGPKVTPLPVGKYHPEAPRGRAGQIHRLVMQNFMCHAHQEVVFGKHVNIISGTNGSGKSATLQALQLALGARAAQTGRATSNMQLVRTGCQRAVISVWLWNTGDNAFQRELYGEAILVRKTISKSSKVELLNTAEQVVASGASAVNMLLEHIGVDACNPITVLTQDMARSMLSGGQTERHMYDFYFRATGLDEVMAQLHAIEEDTKLIRCGLKSASDRLEKLEEEMAEVDDMRSALEHSSLLQGLQESLLNLIPWSKVLTARRRIAEVEESLSTTPALLADLRDKRDAAAKQVEGLADEVKQMERRVEELLGDIEKCAEKDKEAREVIAAEKKRLNAKETEIRDLRESIRNIKDKLAEVVQETGAPMPEQDEFDIAISQFQDRLRMTQAEVDQLRTLEESQRAEEEEREEEATRLEEQMVPARGRVDGLLGEQARVREDIKRLTESIKSTRALFGGQTVERLHREIQANVRRFSRPPIGPIGSSLHSTPEGQQRWRLLEAALGSVLEYFICNSWEDLKLLRQLAKAAGHNLKALVMPHGAPKYDLPPSEMPSGVLRVIDVVGCSDAAIDAPVFNALLDLASADLVGICDREELAQEAAWKGPDRRKLSKVFAPVGSSVVQFSGSKTFRNRFPVRRQLMPRIGANEARLREDLQRKMAEKARLEEETKEADREVRQLQSQAELVRRSQRELRQQRVQTTQRIAATMNELEDIQMQRPVRQTQPDCTQGTEGQIAALKDTLAEMEEQLVVEEGTLKGMEWEFRMAEQRRKATADAWQQAKQRAAGMRELLNGALGRKAELEEEKGEHEKALDEEQRREEEARSKLPKEQKELSEAEALVHELCPNCSEDDIVRDLTKVLQQREKEAQTARFAVPEKVTLDNMLPVEDLERLLTKWGRQESNAAKHVTIPVNEVRERAADLERDIEALRKSRMRVRELFVIVRDSLTKRKASVARARDLDQKATTMRFHEYMSRKGHSAAMEVDDDQRALNLSVSMKGHEGTTEDLKSLSGGERSYTTVSWLLAVGHSTRSPFKAFDEYDVFQDATARRITTTCLLEYAADNPEVQILLLTPQDTSAINEAEHDLERFRGASLPDHFMTMLRMRAARENATYA